MAAKDLGEGLKGKGWFGVAIGAAVLAPMVVPALGKALRPVAKEAIKGFLALSEKARETLAEANEQMQDLVAEAKAEYEQGAEAEVMTDETYATPPGDAGAPLVMEQGGESSMSSGQTRRPAPAPAEPEAI